MPTKNGFSLLSCLLLAGLLVVMSGCSFNQGAQSGSSNKPDSVQIGVGEEPVATLTVVNMVQKLYSTIYALPQMPKQRTCTLELGRSYNLTFRVGGKTLVMVRADRYGCRPVSITGETQDRQATATNDFWLQLDKAIFEGTPVAKPERLAVLHTLKPDQLPQTAQILSAEKVQRLYNAILALPLLPMEGRCPDEITPEYRFVFHTADQVIPSSINKKCNTISLQGNYRSRSGNFTMNEQFKRLLDETLSGAVFAPARPDQLLLAVQPRNGASQQIKIGDAALMQAFYEKFFTLHSTHPQLDCPSGADKIAGKGTFYYFSFSQWDLPLLQISVYVGSCMSIFDGAEILQGDQEFWDLFHQAIAQS